MKKTITLVLILSFLLPFGIYAAQVDAFDDVPSGHWAYEDIQRLYNVNVFIGYSDGLFKPDNTITRAEFIKVISLLSIREEEEDVDLKFLEKYKLSNHWGYSYLEIAARKGLITLHDTEKDIDLMKFDGDITRAEMALLMARAFKEDIMNYDAPLSDIKEINKNHKEAIEKIFGKGIIKGYPNNTFAPYNDSTRAEAAVVINRYVKSLKLTDDQLRKMLQRGTPFQS